MFGMDDLAKGAVSGIVGPLAKLLGQVLPDDKAKADAKLKLLQLDQDGQLKELAQSMSAINNEAMSKDPWTSRARPSFLYVMYIMILFAIPVGLLSVFKPEMAIQIGAGMGAWLKAIPTEMWTTMTIVMTGYTLGRSYEKGKGVSK